MHLGSFFNRQPACLCPAGQSKASGMSRVVPQPVDTSTVPFRPRQATFAHQRTPRNGSGNGPTPRSGKKLTGPQSTFERGPITQPRPTYFGPGGPVHRAYDRPWTQGFLFLLLFLALFMLDIFKVCLAAKSHDDGLYGTLFAILCVFFIEILVCSACKPAYIGGFFFWCDVVGTISLVFDIPWLVPGVDSSSSMLRASRTTRVGARAARVTKMIRVLRVVRVVRVVKLLKYMRAFGAKKGDDGEQEELPPATRVSNALSEAISKRVAMLVMFLVLAIPLLQYDALKAVPQRAHLDAFERQLEAGKGLTVSEVADFFDYYVEADARPWKLRYGGAVAYCPQGKRHDANEPVVFMSATAVAAAGGTSTGVGDPTSIFSNVDYNVQLSGRCTVPATCVTVDINTEPRIVSEAVLNIVLISIVIVCLLGFTMTLQNKVGVIVVQPLERIFKALSDGMGELLMAVKRHHGTDVADGERDENDADSASVTEMDVLATAVAKLSRLGASVTNHSTGVGSEAAKIMLSDDNIDDGTKKWLVGAYTQAGGRHGQLSSDIERRKSQSKTMAEDGPEPLSPLARSRRRMSSISIKPTRSSMVHLRTGGASGGEGGCGTPGASLQTASLQRMLNGVTSFEFDVLECAPEQLAPVTTLLFDTAGVTKDFEIDGGALATFIDTVLEGYRDNPYHNAFHAVDVMQSVVMMLSVSNASQVVAALDIFAVLLASLGHDLAHPGVTADFLVQTRHELAMTYNDTSVLENMHTSQLFAILKEDRCNVLRELPECEWRDLRKAVVASVLATDMVHHFKMVSDVEVFCEMNEEALRDPEECAELFKSEKNTHFLLSLFIHSADIGNPAASWVSCEKWAHRVMDEFFAQGDRELELGMPVSPMFDRATVVRPVMQVHSVTAIAAAAVHAAATICPCAQFP